MKVLADECCSAHLVTTLRDAEHDVVWITEEMSGAPDEVVLRQAYAQERLLITEDKDFGELVVRLQLPARGVVLLRFDEEDASRKASRLLSLLHRNADQLMGYFVVLEPERTRRRPLYA